MPINFARHIPFVLGLFLLAVLLPNLNNTAAACKLKPKQKGAGYLRMLRDMSRGLKPKHTVGFILVDTIS
jgi:hypothetical protein